MRRISLGFVVVALAVLGWASPALAEAPTSFYAVQFPEKQEVGLSFSPTSIAPSAGMVGEVEYIKGQAHIRIEFTDMKPAILFGGDVTCFVVWAVTRDGQTENLGELLTPKAKGKLEFSTGKKNFALVVTAESFFLAKQPSDLVIFSNGPSRDAGIESALFDFDAFAEAPRHSMDGIAHIIWDSKVPIELLQARKAFELAEDNDAATHAPKVFEEARAAVDTANKFAAFSSKSRDLLDSSRRAVALSNEALNISLHRIEAIRIEEDLARRRAETEALEARAAEAEASAKSASELAAEVSAEAARVRDEKDRLLAETAALQNEKSNLESGMLLLRREKADLETESIRLQGDKSMLELEAARLTTEKAALQTEATRLLTEKAALEQEAERLRGEKESMENEARRLETEKNALSGRLHSALSQVADTEQSIRGLVVNLPDILFDLNEAELKPETQIILAKLAGILLIMEGQSATIEGHTDSTGDPAYNVSLSERRAGAVMQFLNSQGLSENRLTAHGFGMDQPVADNDTDEGRRRNRRVEIVISGTASDAVASN